MALSTTLVEGLEEKFGQDASLQSACKLFTSGSLHPRGLDSYRANLEHPDLYSMYILIARPPAKKRSPVMK